MEFRNHRKPCNPSGSGDFGDLARIAEGYRKAKLRKAPLSVGT